jgi:hypothetical protein
MHEQLGPGNAVLTSKDIYFYLEQIDKPVILHQGARYKITVQIPPQFASMYQESMHQLVISLRSKYAQYGCDIESMTVRGSSIDLTLVNLHPEPAIFQTNSVEEGIPLGHLGILHNEPLASMGKLWQIRDYLRQFDPDITVQLSGRQNPNSPHETNIFNHPVLHMPVRELIVPNRRPLSPVDLNACPSGSDRPAFHGHIGLQTVPFRSSLETPYFEDPIALMGTAPLYIPNDYLFYIHYVTAEDRQVIYPHVESRLLYPRAKQGQLMSQVLEVDRRDLDYNGRTPQGLYVVCSVYRYASV